MLPLTAEGALILPRNYSSRIAETDVTLAGATMLYGFTASSSNAAARFIQVFDLDALPADGTVPTIVISCAATADREMQWIPPRRMNRGIVIAGSTTQNTLTLGAAEFLFDVQFV